MSKAYERIATALLAMTDEAGQWQPCWHKSGLDLPVNAVTGHRYQGVNILSAWIAAETRGFSSPKWATYQQWQEAGAQVRKGEKGTPFVVFKTYEKTNDNGEAERTAFARGFTVFNAVQVEGFEDLDAGAPSLNPDERIAGADAFARRTGAVIAHGGSQACYMPAADRIQMPPFESFHHAVGYYGTLLHELTHWTRAKHRLNRSWDAPDGERKRYALEELVAELGAAFLCADLGLEPEPRADHAQYLAHWHAALKNDVAAFMKAVAQASAAAQYLHGLQEEKERAAA